MSRKRPGNPAIRLGRRSKRLGEHGQSDGGGESLRVSGTLSAALERLLEGSAEMGKKKVIVESWTPVSLETHDGFISIWIGHGHGARRANVTIGQARQLALALLAEAENLEGVIAPEATGRAKRVS